MNCPECCHHVLFVEGTAPVKVLVRTASTGEVVQQYVQVIGPAEWTVDSMVLCTACEHRFKVSEAAHQQNLFA